MKTKGLSRGEILLGMERGVFKEGAMFKDVSEQGVSGVIVIISDEENETVMVWKHDDTAFVQLRNCLTESWDLIQEPQFEVGDWVVFDRDNPIIAKIIAPDNELESKWWKTDYVEFGHRQMFPERDLRHATPEEITLEEKRREEEKKQHFWSELGREVDEYRKGDICKWSDKFLEVIGTPYCGLVRCREFNESDDAFEDFNVWTNSVSLVCPTEKRLDTEG